MTEPLPFLAKYRRLGRVCGNIVSTPTTKCGSKRLKNSTWRNRTRLPAAVDLDAEVHLEVAWVGVVVTEQWGGGGGGVEVGGGEGMEVDDREVIGGGIGDDQALSGMY